MDQLNTQPGNTRDIEALADSLTACANELHERIMKAIRRNPPGGPGREPRPGTGAAAPAADTVPVNGTLEHGISHGAAQALFENEVALRQRASSLYLDAAVLAAAGLGVPQRELLDLVALARRRIRHANILKDVIGIAADMLGLAAAIAAGKPEHLAAVLESIKERGARLKEEGGGERGGEPAG
ncbi:hypothetical protein LJR289_003004 [Pseudoduganella sp. LjRoot289]|uniref:hypothetical protein n=1 Tax=Pseudoduganella sp. LjRoot289 TaxID=3342314 RepID=UPI003ED13199